ncbi:hypothetical protein [Streptococcus parasanguinis]|mgnify:FL=1|uniref:Uncharacterized protein n=1 Tax=Streptococcus parasanguinis F0405 TaxID=905067 RepID=E3CBE7_STRPA|nr:hypothetical protein [Streptococcus parasanguinis]EFQ55957.1 hypothetical protein HMPREF9626_0942 [Streptococcus parasanguinis F0405]
MKKGKLAILLATTAVIAGGVIITSQKQNIFSNAPQQRKQLSAKEKQLAYLKEHDNEIKEFVKSQNPKVKSVQIAWDETQWEEIGNGTPKGGGDVIRVFGGFNQIKNSSWSVLIYIKDIKNNEEDFIEGIGSGGPLRVGGEYFDE